MLRTPSAKGESQIRGWEEVGQLWGVWGGIVTPQKPHSSIARFAEGIPGGGGSSGGSVLRWSNCDTSWKVLEVPTEMANVGTNSLTLPPAGRPTWTRAPLPATRPRPLGWIRFSTPNPLVPLSQLRSTTPKVKKCLPSLFMTWWRT